MGPKILYIDWNCLCSEDVLEVFRQWHAEILTLPAPKEHKFERQDDYTELVLFHLQKEQPDVVFSMNFMPAVSLACERAQVKYISWIYDNPQTGAYDVSVRKECNYVFTFDSFMEQDLQKKGAPHVYYAPMAANCKRLSALKPTSAEQKEYACQVAFVGSLYNEENDYCSVIFSRLQDKYFQGYLEGLLNAQKKVYGYNFLAECLPPEILSCFHSAGAWRANDTSLLTEPEVYADVYLSKKLATINRYELLYLLGEFFDVHLYSYKPCQLTNVTQRGEIRYYDRMPKLFQTAQINLNDTRRSIKNGIPLRAMEIMGCGGFLLSNYQEDFFRHFEPDKHMVLYGSLEEALDKCNYYLKHDTEREKIRENAYAIMEKEHTYEIRLRQMFQTAGCL